MKIDRNTMELIDELERQLQTFHGFRHLWAELIANHEPCGLTEEKLNQQQSDRLSAVLGVAYTIALQQNVRWVGCCKTRDFIQELADEPCSYGDNCPPFSGTRHGDCIHCKARKALAL